MNIQNYILSISSSASDLIGVETYNVSMLDFMWKKLMACKEAFEYGREPSIDYALLNSKHINVLGKELSFNQYIIAA